MTLNSFMNIKKKVLYFLTIQLILKFVESTTVCFSDYKLTKYNLYCQNPNDRIIVSRLTATFVPRSQLVFDCIAESAFILNNSNTLSVNLCNYCYNQKPCVINADIIDRNKLFSIETYNVGNVYMPTPINIGIYYECISESGLSAFSQSQVCLYTVTNPNLIFSTTTPSFRTSTTTRQTIRSTTSSTSTTSTVTTSTTSSTRTTSTTRSIATTTTSRTTTRSSTLFSTTSLSSTTRSTTRYTGPPTTRNPFDNPDDVIYCLSGAESAFRLNLAFLSSFSFIFYLIYFNLMN